MKFLIALILAVALCENAFAKTAAANSPDTKHEIAVGLGTPSAMRFAVGWVFDFIDAFNNRKDKTSYYGCWSLTYHYQALDWMRVGGKFVYEGSGYEFYTDKAKTTKKGHHTLNWFGFMATVQFTYLRTDFVKLYAGFDLGIGGVVSVDRYKAGFKSDNGKNVEREGSVIPAFDITPFGILFGRSVYGVVELNIGTDAFVKAGCGVRF